MNQKTCTAVTIVMAAIVYTPILAGLVWLAAEHPGVWLWIIILATLGGTAWPGRHRGNWLRALPSCQSHYLLGDHKATQPLPHLI